MAWQDRLRTPAQWGMQDLYAAPEREEMRWASQHGRTGLEALQPSTQAREVLAQRQLFQDVLPALREGYGGAALYGSGYPSQALGATGDLAARLAAQREQSQLDWFDRYRSLFGMGLQPQQPWYTPETLTPTGEAVGAAGPILSQLLEKLSQSIPLSNPEYQLAEGLQQSIGEGSTQGALKDKLLRSASKTALGALGGAASGASGGPIGAGIGAGIGGLAALVQALVGR